MNRGFILGLCALLCLLCAGEAQATDLFVLKTKTNIPVVTIDDQGSLWHKGTLTANLSSIPAPASNIDAWVLRDASGSIKMLVELSNLTTGQVLGNVKIRGSVAGGTPPTGTPGANDVSIRNSAGTEVARLSIATGGVSLSGTDDSASYVDSNQFGRLKLYYNVVPPHTLYRGHLVWVNSAFIPFDGADMGSGYWARDWTNRGTSGWYGPGEAGAIVGYPTQNQAAPTCTWQWYNYSNQLQFTLTGSFPLTFKEPAFLATGSLFIYDGLSNPSLANVENVFTGAPWYNDRFNGGYFHHDVRQGGLTVAYSGTYAAITPEGNPNHHGSGSPELYATYLTNAVVSSANYAEFKQFPIAALPGKYDISYPTAPAATYSALRAAINDIASPTPGTFVTTPRQATVYQVGEPTWNHPSYHLDAQSIPYPITVGCTLNPPQVHLGGPAGLAPYKIKLTIRDPAHANFTWESIVPLTGPDSGSVAVQWYGYLNGPNNAKSKLLASDYFMEVDCYFLQRFMYGDGTIRMGWQEENAVLYFSKNGQWSPSVTRAEDGSFVVATNANSKPVTISNWAFSGTHSISEPSKSDGVWQGIMVETGTASCDVRIGATTHRVASGVTVNPRTGNDWKITPTCHQDDDPNWGGYPQYPVPADEFLGLNQHYADRAIYNGNFWANDRISNYNSYYSVSGVNAGPNKGLWFVTSTSFDLDRATLINKYLKPNQGTPSPPGVNFYNFNVSKSVDMAGVLAGVKGHEAYGIPGNPNGHQQKIEFEEAKPGNDAREEIEKAIGVSEDDIRSRGEDLITEIEKKLQRAAQIEPTGNWSGTYYIWDRTALPATVFKPAAINN